MTAEVTATQTQTDVLEFLAEHHPELHAVAELDRSWVWLPVDLRGEEHRATREAIGKQGIGFRYAKNGHTLPSGKVGTWGHHCDKPIPFRRKGKGGNATGKDGASDNPLIGMSDDQLMAALTGLG